MKSMMQEQEIKNLEEMTNKIREYILAVEPNDDDVVIDMCMVAGKFIIGSFLKRGEDEATINPEDIFARCTTVALICVAGGERR